MRNSPYIPFFKTLPISCSSWHKFPQISPPTKFDWLFLLPSSIRLIYTSTYCNFNFDWTFYFLSHVITMINTHFCLIVDRAENGVQGNVSYKFGRHFFIWLNTLSVRSHWAAVRPFLHSFASVLQEKHCQNIGWRPPPSEFCGSPRVAFPTRLTRGVVCWNSRS